MSPQRAGSRTIAAAAFSASARNVSGRAWTSLRSAAFASGVTADDGPATRNSVRASAAVSPLRSVRAPPIERPATAPAGLGVDGDAGDRERLEVAPGGADRHLQLLGHLGRRHPAAGLEEQEGGDEAIGTHAAIIAGETGHQVATSVAEDAGMDDHSDTTNIIEAIGLTKRFGKRGEIEALAGLDLAGSSRCR